MRHKSRGVTRLRGLCACRIGQPIPSDAGYAHPLTMGVVLRQVGLAGAAGAELVDGVRQLRPEEAMLRGWRAQQTARGLRASTIDPREALVHRFVAFTNEFPWQWGPGHVDEWTLTLTAEHHLAPVPTATGTRW